jgi:hypothetical protein
LGEGWRYGSSGRAPALQMQSPKFKHQSHRKKETGRNQKWNPRENLKRYCHQNKKHLLDM